MFLKKLPLVTSRTLLVEDFISMDDLKVFVLYDLGFWDLFDLRKHELLNSGRIKKLDGEDIHLRVHDKENLLTYTTTKGQLRMLNVKENTYNNDWD